MIRQRADFLETNILAEKIGLVFLRAMSKLINESPKRNQSFTYQKWHLASISISTFSHSRTSSVRRAPWLQSRRSRVRPILRVSSEIQKFEMKVTGSYSNDAMLRQISEGVRIDQVPEDSLMSQERMELFPRSTRGNRTWPLKLEYTMLAYMTLANT